MKEIQPVSIWYNGIMIAATIINMANVDDNLTDSATFMYQLFSVDKIVLAVGSIKMTGVDYITYSSSPNSNDYAYTWGASQLNITLI